MELKEILQKHNVYSEELYNGLKNYIHPVKIDSLSQLNCGPHEFYFLVLKAWEMLDENAQFENLKNFWYNIFVR